MKKIHLFFAAGLLFLTSFCYSQDIPQSEIPSLIINNFKQQFPKAIDPEWEIIGDQYKVEFEAGFFKDHEVWFNKTGTILKHKQDISSGDLPEAVVRSVKKDFNGYRIEDVERTEANNTVTYTFELKSSTQEWKVAFGEDGKILEKTID